MSSGNYPTGAANDSAAPYNQGPGVECPLCDGSGKIQVGHVEYLSEIPYSEWVVDYEKRCTLCYGFRFVEQSVADDFNSDD